jgi:hypothetical protein
LIDVGIAKTDQIRSVTGVEKKIQQGNGSSSHTIKMPGVYDCGKLK